MAININFYSFSKKEQSTAQPSGEGTVYSCKLKDVCSVLSPEIILEYATVATNPTGFNYARIPAFNRYYFITNWTWSNRCWVASLSVDYLASYKTEIGNLNAYVLRSASASNGNIIDNRYPTTGDTPAYSAYSVQNPLGWVDTSTAGTWIVGIINGNATGGSVEYFAMDYSTFSSFKSYIFGSVDWMNISTDEISANLQRALINPYNYVVSCLFYNFNPATISGTTKAIKLGFWTTTISAKQIGASTMLSRVTSLNIPRHPQASRGNYLNLSPYSTYMLRYYPFGTMQIDAQTIVGYNTLDLYVDIDLTTGKGVLNIAVNGKDNPIMTLDAQVGVPIPVSGTTVDFSGISTASLAVSGVVAGATAVTGTSAWDALTDFGSENYFQNLGNAIGRDLKGGATSSSIGNATAQMLSKVSSKFDAGSMNMADLQNLTLSGMFIYIAEEDNSHNGRPLCANVQINTLSGFVQCADSDIAIACTNAELQAIGASLTSGFFYE